MTKTTEAETTGVPGNVADAMMAKLSAAERMVVARTYAVQKGRAAKAEMELAGCKKLAIATLCDGDEGHEGPGGTLERVIALAKECHNLTSDVGEANAAFRDLCLAVETKDAQAIETILDEKWRGKESEA